MSPAPPRRTFLGRLLAGAAAVTVAPAIRPLHAEEPEPLVNQSPWDDSWVRRITARHRQVFDAPEIAEGTVLHQARTWIQGYRDLYGTTDADHSAVLVIRHSAMPIVLPDALWDRWRLGKEFKLKDPTTGKEARRNPFLNGQRGDRYALTWPDGGLDHLLARGAIVLACHLALRRWVGRLAQDDGIERTEADARLRGMLVPGVIVQPSGIFAVTRAQEAGCQYIRAT